VVWLRIMAAAIEPAHSRPVDELISAAANGAGGRHGAEGTCRPSPWVTKVPCSRHCFLAANHLRKGAVVSLVAALR